MEVMAPIKIIIDKNDLHRIAEAEIKKMLDSTGSWWDLKRLEAETCRKRDWLLDNILLNPRFKDEMEHITNLREGGRWMFRATEMKLFLEKNFDDLNRRKSPRKRGSQSGIG